MRISKSKLKQIIQEEFTGTLKKYSLKNEGIGSTLRRMNPLRSRPQPAKSPPYEERPGIRGVTTKEFAEEHNLNLAAVEEYFKNNPALYQNPEDASLEDFKYWLQGVKSGRPKTSPAQQIPRAPKPKFKPSSGHWADKLTSSVKKR